MTKWVLAAVMLLAGCANQQYGGLNYGELETPDGEHWKIVGGKDETNVSLTVTRPDGTKVEYHADNADASTVMKTLAEGNVAQAEAFTKIIERLMPAPGVVP